MARGLQIFRQSDITKAIMAAQKAGLDVRRFEIDRAGKIVVIADKAAVTQVDIVAPERVAG
jgi:hypothetical protein